MKLRKTALFMLIGLLLAAFAVAMAQTPNQGDQKKSEACCAMETCCCNSGSCPLKAEGASADAKDASCCCSGDSCEMKDPTEANKDSAHHACCGDSCDMKHDANMKHDAKMKHDKKSDGAKPDCCKIKSKDAKDKTQKKAA